ncbi:putative Glutaredoxin and related protein [Vibrio nigripulchritudo MADA3029]|uniref:Putative Glutaredoxin and related protein n=1 Tax=Vibrio nigripulchritudo TaxID=28173 RepID=U4KB72_9VIBR|nr:MULTISPECIES: glutaredoxin domain-containing protein [Vibrio]EGU58403.1 hypothetical protein VINI7043_23972 [Vibrio nigripulchritudo ATCC 27043]KJY73560.1 glutaredoxin [Vibrio nigripulchritudo]UAB73435.1 glutaredoxin [Vibrio sp. SCSIO 43132]CCN37917.1 putative Glutaredoxin and related protein [Vibrio nigripulchritudo AM115]CCN41265.1 putative Glutaredoxin and related protein [Vibrio nigripulchritudo FTn2]
MQIEMFSKDNCPQCVTAASWVAQQGLKLSQLKLDIDFDRETLFELFPMARSYPQFRVNGQPVGDFETLKNQLAFSAETSF